MDMSSDWPIQANPAWSREPRWNGDDFLKRLYSGESPIISHPCPQSEHDHIRAPKPSQERPRWYIPARVLLLTWEGKTPAEYCKEWHGRRELFRFEFVPDEVRNFLNGIYIAFHYRYTHGDSSIAGIDTPFPEEWPEQLRYHLTSKINVVKWDSPNFFDYTKVGEAYAAGIRAYAQTAPVTFNTDNNFAIDNPSLSMYHAYICESNRQVTVVPPLVWTAYEWAKEMNQRANKIDFEIQELKQQGASSFDLQAKYKNQEFLRLAFKYLINLRFLHRDGFYLMWSSEASNIQNYPSTATFSHAEGVPHENLLFHRDRSGNFLEASFD